MIHIFHKIRRQLLDENKIGRYLKYAIGEIILVVIGILIALQVNNWNEGRKKSRDINMMLFELKNDLITDSLTIHDKMALLGRDVKLQQELIDKLETNSVLDSSFNEHLGRVGIMRRVNFIRNGYDGVKNLGFENIQDHELRKAIITYYNDLIFQLLKDIEDDEDEFKNLFLPTIRQNFVDWDFGSYGIPRNYEALSKDDEFEITLRINYLNRLSTLRRMEQASKELNRIIVLINQYVGS